MANRLLPAAVRDGALLDIGCGSQPFFLRRARAAQRVGLDRLVPKEGRVLDDIQLVHHDVMLAPALPFGAGTFDAVTMLAVFEHIPPAPLHQLLLDIRRVLRPGGRLVLTTPAGWTDPLLRLLARLRLVSAEEIDEHEAGYDRRQIRLLLERAGFHPAGIATGSFELAMNLWATADR
jgi:SAM-dependent methyltransferase